MRSLLGGGFDQERSVMSALARRMLKPIVEFVILAGLGGIAVVQGLELEHHNRPKGVYDRIGAGYFLFGIGVALLIVGAIYLISQLRHCRTVPEVQDLPKSDRKPQTYAMPITVALTALNIFLIPIFGYLFPTMLFFVLSFTIFKLTRSQLWNVILGVGVGIIFFLLFQHALGMFFPTGRFGLDFGVK